MIELDRTQNQKIHRRKIETVIYEGQAGTIVVGGSLEDRRFCDSHLFSGEIER